MGTCEPNSKSTREMVPWPVHFLCNQRKGIIDNSGVLIVHICNNESTSVIEFRGGIVVIHKKIGARRQDVTRALETVQFKMYGQLPRSFRFPQFLEPIDAIYFVRESRYLVIEHAFETRGYAITKIR